MMIIKTQKALMLLGMAAFAVPSLSGAATFTTSSGTAQLGTSTTISVDYTADGDDVAGIDLDIIFDDAQFTTADTTCANQTVAPGAFTNCSTNPAGTGNIIIASANSFVDGLSGEINLTVAGGATPGMYPFTITVVGASDSLGVDIPVGNITTVNGTLTISAGPAPMYGSTPAAGSMLNFGPALAGSGNLTTPLSITNNGDVGSTLNTTCTLSGADAGQFAVDAALSTAIAQGASVSGNVTCNDPGIGNDATFTASLDCAHDGSNASPASYPLSCVYNPPFAQIIPTPADGSTRNIVVPGFGGSGNTSVSFNETSNDGVDGTVDCVLSGADAGLFTITAPAVFPATVVSGGSVQVTVNGTEPGDGSAVVASLDCAIGDGVGGTSNVSFPLGFIVQPQVVPTMSQIGMILMGLFLAAVGFMTLRRKASV